MNCSQANSLLVAFLNNEASILEKEAIQAHLINCPTCQKELKNLSALENRLVRQLHLQAEQVHPSSNALTDLQTRIQQKKTQNRIIRMKNTPIFFPIQNKTALQKFSLGLLVFLALLIAAPPVMALADRISAWVGTWFHFATPGTGSSMGVGGFEAFTPYAPQYLPKGFDSNGIGSSTAPNLDQLKLTYSKGNQFVTLLQSKGPGAGNLPLGKNVEISHVAGVFVPVFATSGEQLQQKIPGISVVTNFDYERTSLLAWYIGEIKIELVSNLPEAEILMIAQSLSLVEIK